MVIRRGPRRPPGSAVSQPDTDANGHNGYLSFEGVPGEVDTNYVFRLADENGNIFNDIDPLEFERYTYSSRNRIDYFYDPGNFAPGDTIMVITHRTPQGGSTEKYNTKVVVQNRVIRRRR